MTAIVPPTPRSLLGRLDRVEEAIRVWQRALALAPHTPGLRRDLAWASTLVGR